MHTARSKEYHWSTSITEALADFAIFTVLKLFLDYFAYISDFMNT